MAADHITLMIMVLMRTIMVPTILVGVIVPTIMAEVPTTTSNRIRITATDIGQSTKGPIENGAPQTLNAFGESAALYARQRRYIRPPVSRVQSSSGFIAQCGFACRI